MNNQDLHVFDLPEETVNQLAPILERYAALQCELEQVREYYQVLLEAQCKLLVGKDYEKEVCWDDVVMFSEGGKHLIYGKYCEGCADCVGDNE